MDGAAVEVRSYPAQGLAGVTTGCGGAAMGSGGAGGEGQRALPVPFASSGGGVKVGRGSWCGRFVISSRFAGLGLKSGGSGSAAVDVAVTPRSRSQPDAGSTLGEVAVANGFSFNGPVLASSSCGAGGG